MPVGVAIGFNPRVSQVLQPIAQIAASFPATALFPLILVAYAFCFMLPLKQWVRALVMLLSPLWAIFCNVIRIIATICIYV